MAPLYRKAWKKIKGTKPPRYKRVWVRIAYPTATHYSPNFTRKELDCRCGCVAPKHIQRNLAKLASSLEKMRPLVPGGKIAVNSGYRCPAHNKAVGGASKSQHMSGLAADLRVPPGSQNKYVKAAMQVPEFNNGGIGVYPNGGVHVDRRGYRARWNDWVRGR